MPPVTVATWARVAPADFVATAASELAGTSETAPYGPPYNNGPGAPKASFAPALWRGAPAHRRRPTFVLSPLEKVAPTDPALAGALATYDRSRRARPPGTTPS